jgi:hypothetical protein
MHTFRSAPVLQARIPGSRKWELEIPRELWAHRTGCKTARLRCSRLRTGCRRKFHSCPALYGPIQCLSKVINVRTPALKFRPEEAVFGRLGASSPAKNRRQASGPRGSFRSFNFRGRATFWSAQCHGASVPARQIPDDHSLRANRQRRVCRPPAFAIDRTLPGATIPSPKT